MFGALGAVANRLPDFTEGCATTATPIGPDCALHVQYMVALCVTACWNAVRAYTHNFYAAGAHKEVRQHKARAFPTCLCPDWSARPVCIRTSCAAHCVSVRSAPFGCTLISLSASSSSVLVIYVKTVSHKAYCARLYKCSTGSMRACPRTQAIISETCVP